MQNTNNLIVRRESPIENVFFVDNIEIPNINHFPTQASSGGPIGLVNVDFIQDVNFYTGGFSSIYGDSLINNGYHLSGRRTGVSLMVRWI